MLHLYLFLNWQSSIHNLQQFHIKIIAICNILILTISILCIKYISVFVICLFSIIHILEKVLNLISEVCSTKISPKYWESFVSHVIKEEDKFRKTDYIVDNEMEPVIINYCSSKVFWGGTTVNCLISFCAKLYAWCCSKSYNR